MARIPATIPYCLCPHSHSHSASRRPPGRVIAVFMCLSTMRGRILQPVGPGRSVRSVGPVGSVRSVGPVGSVRSVRSVGPVRSVRSVRSVRGRGGARDVTPDASGPRPNFPPTTPEELDALSDDFPRTSTSSISTVDNTSNVVKATFQPQLLSEGVQERYREAPWARTFHLNERNLVWSDDFKERLFKKVAAEELNMTEEDLEMKLLHLQTLMPDAAGKLANMNISSLVLILENIEELPQRLLVIKSMFPEANASLLAIRSTWMLSRKLAVTELEELLQRTADDLRELFPRLNVDKVVEENPECLDVDALREALAEAESMGIRDVQALMGRDPQAVLGFQRGGRMISGGFD